MSICFYVICFLTANWSKDHDPLYSLHHSLVLLYSTRIISLASGTFILTIYTFLLVCTGCLRTFTSFAIVKAWDASLYNLRKVCLFVCLPVCLSLNSSQALWPIVVKLGTHVGVGPRSVTGGLFLKGQGHWGQRSIFISLRPLAWFHPNLVYASGLVQELTPRGQRSRSLWSRSY